MLLYLLATFSGRNKPVQGMFTFMSSSVQDGRTSPLMAEVDNLRARLTMTLQCKIDPELMLQNKSIQWMSSLQTLQSLQSKRNNMISR